VCIAYGELWAAGLHCNTRANSGDVTLTIFLQHGDRNLENVTHEEAVATLKATQERVVLIVGKTEASFIVPPMSSSPLPRKYQTKTNICRVLTKYYALGLRAETWKNCKCEASRNQAIPNKPL